MKQMINGKMVDTGETEYKLGFFTAHRDFLVKPKEGDIRLRPIESEEDIRHARQVIQTYKNGEWV